MYHRPWRARQILSGVQEVALVPSSEAILVSCTMPGREFQLFDEQDGFGAMSLWMLPMIPVRLKTRFKTWGERLYAWLWSELQDVDILEGPCRFGKELYPPNPDMLTTREALAACRTYAHPASMENRNDDSPPSPDARP